METEKRLKKDLKRTKVLLADAQIMLDHLRSNAPSKRELAQLKNQVYQRMLYCVSKGGGLKFNNHHDSKQKTVFKVLVKVAKSSLVPISEGRSVRSILDPSLLTCASSPSSCFPQLEESEFTCAAAVKARKSMEIEIEDLHIQMEDVVKAKLSVSFDIAVC